MRLIDPEALLTAKFPEEEDVYQMGWNDALAAAFCEAPTVDAVEVVRCKDCRQWSRNVGVADSPNGHCFCHDIEMNGYDFCSYGERKDA